MTAHQTEFVVGESYFNLDGDTEIYAIESEDHEERMPLSWRGDPAKTFSDWRIIVVTKNHKPRTYQVHRSILSNGPRSSKYFSKLFASSKSKSTPSKFLRSHSIVSNGTSTKIELDERDARNFPDMLDFIYDGASMPSMSSSGTAATELSSVVSSASFQLRSNSSIEEEAILSLGDGINTNNSVSLRHLSRLLGCETLTLSINKFIQRDLSFKTGPIYYKHADEYKDERLAGAAKRLCSENFEKISVKSLMRLPIHLMKDLVESVGSNKGISKSTSLVLSEVVYLYLERHPELLNPGNLLDLTDKIPKIGPEPAIGFTALVRDLDSKATAAHWTRLVDLCKRCAEAVVGEFGWTDFSIDSALHEYLAAVSQNKQSRTDSLLFSTSFAAALQQAQRDHAEVLKRQEKLEKLQRERQEKMEKAQRDHAEVLKRQEKLEKMVHELQKSVAKKDEQMAEQNKTSEEARKQILFLKKKLSTARQR